MKSRTHQPDDQITSKPKTREKKKKNGFAELWFVDLAKSGVDNKWQGNLQPVRKNNLSRRRLVAEEE